MEHSRDEILSVLKDCEVLSVGTFSADEIRSRMMHYAVDNNFNFYLASLKGDPKTLQLINNPTLSLLVYSQREDIQDAREVEISGKAEFLKDGPREDALNQLAVKSPVVKYLISIGKSDVLDVLQIRPFWIKYRIFSEIVRGEPPTVLEFAKLKTSDWVRFKKKLRAWFTCLRLPFLTASVIPVLLGGALAFSEGFFNPFLFFLTLLAGVFIHLGVNISNDYFDSKSGETDWVNREFIRPFSGGSRVIQLGLLTPLEVFIGAMVFFLLAGVIGIGLAYLTGPFIILLGLIGFISGFFYVAPPFNWVKIGLGELLVGLNFGVLMVLGTYYVQTQRIALEPILASLPISLLISAVLYINEFPDYEADKKTGKNHWVVRLGRSRAAFGYLILIGLTYLVLIPLIKPLNFFLLPIILTIPIGISAIRFALKYNSKPLLMVPANAFTIFLHLAIGIFLACGFIFSRLNNLGPIVLSVIVLGLVYYLFFKTLTKARAMKGLIESSR